MEMTEARTLAADLMGEHGLTALGWTFDFDRGLRRAGACHHSKAKITLSRFFVEANGPQEVRLVLLHEIAHAHCGHGAGHGPAWKRMCLDIGGDGRTTHRFSMGATAAEATSRYEAHCPNEHVVARYARRPSARMIQWGFCKRHAERIWWIDTVSGQRLV